MKPINPSENSLLSRWANSDNPEELMEEVLSKDGLLAQSMPEFEYRREQIIMAKAIVRSCTGNRKLMIEAGTGTGKSLAYLIPLILYATHTGNRVIISTGTKTLQHQLLEKDLPLIQRTLGLRFNAALCLGAENYLCARRFKAWSTSRDPGGSSKVARNRVIQWAKTTRTGIKAEFNPPPEIWRQICRDSDLCPLSLCNKEPNCSYNQARKEWQRAHLLIANHYLFFANLVSGGSVLPEYGAVIFDEAHQLEEVATNYLGMEVSNYGTERYLNSLHNPRTGRGLYGMISYVEPEIREELRQRTQEMRSRSNTLFEAILDKYPGVNERVRMRQPAQGDPLTIEGAKLLLGTLKRVRQEVKDSEDQVEVEAAISSAESILLRLETILHQKRPDSVYWLEIDRGTGRLKPEEDLLEESEQYKKPRVSLNMAPLSVAEALQHQVYRKTGPVVCVSATLSVAGDLEYTAERLGLQSADKVLLPTSFDYANRVMLWVDRSTPDPSQSDRHQAHLIAQLERLLPQVQGGTFVLFTSYRMLDSVFFELKRRWESPVRRAGSDILLLRHGQAPREELLDQFREHGHAALFGTTTFWQGIDVPGKALECVVITKLPFAVPDEPIVEARVEDLREKGRNPFYEYQVPQAVMMFRQGFGRLMRKSDDGGAVVIFDPRVYTKQYGRLFLESIPECAVAESMDDVIDFLTRSS